MTAPAVDPFQQFQSYIDPVTGQSRTVAQAPAGTPYRSTDPLLTDPMGSTYTPSGTVANPLAGYVSAQGGTFGDDSGSDPNRAIEMDAASYDPTAVASALNSSDPTAQSGAIQGLTGNADASHRQGLLEDSSYAGNFTPQWFQSLSPSAQSSLTSALQGAGGDPAAIQQQLATLGAGDGSLVRTDGGTGPGGTFANTNFDPNQTFDATNAPPTQTAAPVDSDPFGRFDDPAHPTHGVITPAIEAQMAQQSGTLSAPPPISDQDLTAAGDPTAQTLPDGTVVPPTSPSTAAVPSPASSSGSSSGSPSSSSSGVPMAASAPSSGGQVMPPGLQPSPSAPIADPFSLFQQANAQGVSGQPGVAPTSGASGPLGATGLMPSPGGPANDVGGGAVAGPPPPVNGMTSPLGPGNVPPISGQPGLAPPSGNMGLTPGFSPQAPGGIPQFGQAATSGIGGGVSGPFNPYGGYSPPPGQGAIFGGFRRITPQQTGPGSAGMGNAQGGGGMSDTAY